MAGTLRGKIVAAGRGSPRTRRSDMAPGYYNAVLYVGHVAKPADVKLSAPAAAERAKVLLNTWWAYVSRGQAPAPDGRDEVSNRAWWWASTVDRWMESRVRSRPV